MSLFQKISTRLLGKNKDPKAAEVAKNAMLRRCRFEVMEERRVLTADPVIAAVTFVEGDAGQDTTPDFFEVSFVGGAETTQLTQFTINGDQDLSGDLSDGDVFFDVGEQARGAGGSHGFEFDNNASLGVNASDIQGVSVSEDGLSLVVDVLNFEAGDVLAFTIDVDEVERFRVDRIASGVEFEGSFFDAEFVDDNYTFDPLDISTTVILDGDFVQPQFEGVFFDEFNNLFAEGESVAGDSIDLTRDNEEGQADRSAAAVDAFTPVARPVEISGTVFHDEDIDCVHDGTEDGISGVSIELQRLNDAGVYETVATTLTDENGDYEFGQELGLAPGNFRLIQIQPDGFLSVNAGGGQVEGVATGETLADRNGEPNVIGNIEIPLGNTAATDLDFKEVLPAYIEGNVFHDANDNGIRESNEEGIANVLIEVTRLGPQQGAANDPFADFTPISVRTDANGHYSVEGLPPGIYEVVEINNYPPGEEDPLAPFLDGQDTIGTVDGVPTGQQGNDRHTQIELAAGEHGIEYNFGELQAGSVSGYVSVDVPGQGKLDPSDPDFEPISGVTIQLLDEQGNVVETTSTDNNGFYEFDELRPGTYSIVQVQPNGFLDGADVVGNVAGVQTGIAGDDRFDNVVIGSGESGTQYNFCEHEPASIKGVVYHDRNDNGIQDAGEEGIEGVLIELFDGDGNLIASVLTDADGHYCFEDLIAGEYHVQQTQPEDFIDGRDTLGQRGGSDPGQVENDVFWVNLEGGDNAVNYNFGELLPASISGFVHTDLDGNCMLDTTAGENPLANVLIELLDADGNVVDTVETDANGAYTFGNLRPGTYTLRQVQPDGFFTGGERVGSGDGTASENLLGEITVSSGDRLVDYNFCEHPPAEIHGLVFEDGPAFETETGEVPANFRSLRDGVFQADTDTPLEGVRVQLFYFVDPAGENNAISPRPVTLGEVQAEFYTHLGTDDPNAEIFVETDENGEYWFQGLPQGSYIVVQTQPDGLVDSNDSSGPTENGLSGFTFNNENDLVTAISPLTETFSDSQLQDTVANIRVNPGGVSIQNNFSEVRVLQVDPVDPVLNPFGAGPTTPPPIQNPLRPSPGITGLPGLAGAQSGNFTSIVGSSRGAAFQTEAQAVADNAYTWHLSVINGGSPRGEGEGASPQTAWQQVGYISNADWSRFDMESAVWTFTTTQDDDIRINGLTQRFGAIGGIPVVGDFDGDGIDEVAVFKDGFWMIDINRNGRWDREDLLARLGDADDRPVTGDWDGDGKDDIGIYGPIWEGDVNAIAHEPGLPNPENQNTNLHKNVPPRDNHATNGARTMKLSTFGTQQSDVVDHVFGPDEESLMPIAGDWTGTGIRSIGAFHDGVWKLDINGDGQFDHEDEIVNFGQAGDKPVVGDFNGDGIEDLAVYRNGTWIIDSNGNRELEITDKTFELGGAADTPIAGDWDGDGTDEPAIYSQQGVSGLN